MTTASILNIRQVTHARVSSLGRQATQGTGATLNSIAEDELAASYHTIQVEPSAKTVFVVNPQNGIAPNISPGYQRVATVMNALIPYSCRIAWRWMTSPASVRQAITPARVTRRWRVSASWSM